MSIGPLDHEATAVRVPVPDHDGRVVWCAGAHGAKMDGCRLQSSNRRGGCDRFATLLPRLGFARPAAGREGRIESRVRVLGPSKVVRDGGRLPRRSAGSATPHPSRRW